MIWLMVVLLAIWIAHQQSRLDALETQLQQVETDIEHIHVFGEPDA